MKIADHAGRSGVTHDIVYAFLENQKHLSPHVGIELHFLVDSGRLKVEVYIAGSQDLARKLTHALRQVAHPVSLNQMG